MYRSTVLFVSLLLPAFAFAHGDVGNGFSERLLHTLGSVGHLWAISLLVATGLLVRGIHLWLRRVIQQETEASKTGR